MSPWSRRRALHVAASTAVAALAGCNARTSGTNSHPTDAAEDPVSGYEVKHVRSANGTRLLRPTDPEVEDPRPAVVEHLTDSSDLDAVSFAETDGAPALQSFVAGTDFETHSVLLYQWEVPACSEIRLVSVTRTSDSVHADFCRARKPADVACDRDDRDLTAIAIRLPFAGDSFSGVGSRMSSSCDRRPRPLYFDDGNATSTADRATAGAPGQRGGR